MLLIQGLSAAGLSGRGEGAWFAIIVELSSANCVYLLILLLSGAWGGGGGISCYLPHGVVDGEWRAGGLNSRAMQRVYLFIIPGFVKL